MPDEEFVVAPDDLASLPELNDDAVLAGIRKRFELNKIYTQINNLLIAMNPYQQLPIYTPELMSSYKAAAIGSSPPHVYGTSAAAYSGLLALRSQVCNATPRSFFFGKPTLTHASPILAVNCHLRRIRRRQVGDREEGALLPRVCRLAQRR